MNRDKQTEIHELAKQMSEAISTTVEQRYIEDEAKLRAVLIENGWHKASDVAEEIFAEIEKETDIMTAKASLFIVGDWNSICGNGSFFERECLMKEQPLFECLNCAYEDERRANDGT